MHKNKNTTQQNECGAATVVFGEKFVILNTYIRREERSKLKYQAFTLSDQIKT